MKGYVSTVPFVSGVDLRVEKKKGCFFIIRGIIKESSILISGWKDVQV